MERGTASFGSRHEVQGNRPLVQKKVCIQMGKIGKFHVVVAAFGMTPFIRPITEEVRCPVGLTIKKDIAILMVRKGKIVETRACAG